MNEEFNFYEELKIVISLVIESTSEEYIKEHFPSLFWFFKGYNKISSGDKGRKKDYSSPHNSLEICTH